MTETHAAEAAAEPVPPAPEAAAELEAVLPEAAPVTPKADVPGLPPIEYPVGPLRMAILDHLADTVDAGPQSVAQILAAMPVGTSRNSGESAIKREFDAGRIERTSPGHYVLAKPKPPAPPKPAAPQPEPERVRIDGPTTDEEWLAVVDAWDADPASWNREILGPWLGEAGNRVPPGVAFHFNEKLRKRKERRRDAEAAAAKQATADTALRDQLLAACNGNFTPGPGIQDISPIKLALDLVPLDIVLMAIRHNVCRLCCPVNPTLSSWRESRLLKALADEYCRSLIVPSLVAGWSAAKAPGKATSASEPSPAAKVPQKPEVAQAVPLPQAVANPDDGPAIDAEPDAAALPVAAGRDQVLAAFARERTPPPPAALQPRPAQPQPRPPERQAEPERMSDEALDEIVEAYSKGLLAWNSRRMGPPPDDPDTDIPLHIRRRHGFA